MNTVTVAFERSSDRRYMARPFTMRVDGAAVAMVHRGRSVVVEIPPGVHDFVAEMDGHSSRPLVVTVREGDRLCFRCVPNPEARFVSPWWSLVSRRLRLRHEQLVDPTGRGAVVLEPVVAPDP